MKPITVTSSTLGTSATDFAFEDLFPSSPVEGGWSAPDGASYINGVEAIEEDIGGEQEYDDEDIEEPEMRTPPTPAEPLKMSSHIGTHSFTKLALVGKGGFGTVNQVIYKETNEVFAMKTLKKRHLIDTKSVENTIAEKDVLRKVRHPFVVRLHYAFQSDTKVHLIMDFINGGQLLHHMHRDTMFTEAQAKFYIAEVILALDHLHGLNIIHRDLKPENVLLDATGHCVLTDFGFAKENVLTPESCTSFCGTLEYMAPEVVKKNKYGKAADWWSVGILLYDMVVGNPPFTHKNDNVLYKKILNDKLKLPKFLSKDCINLLKGLINRNLKTRFTLKELKAHKFFSGQSWDKMLRKEIRPPIIPITKKGQLDTSNFDAKFINMKITDSAPESSPLSNSQQGLFHGFSYAKSPPMSFAMQPPMIPIVRLEL